VISFKVDDKVYFALRKKKVSFRSIFEPIAVEIAQNNRRGMKYTGVYKRNDSDLIIYLKENQKIVSKLLKKYENGVKR
jgi:uncharacterized pyridoxamine 5'-phosphate oxidase family protein